jgi:hypothetical protein
MIDFAKQRASEGVRALVYDHLLECLVDQRRHHALSQQKRLRLAVQMVDAIKIVSRLIRLAVLRQWKEDQSADAETAGRRRRQEAEPQGQAEAGARGAQEGRRGWRPRAARTARTARTTPTRSRCPS